MKLLKEKDRPSLDLFVNYGVNGKKSDFDESFKEMVGIDHPKVTFGFNFLTLLVQIPFEVNMLV